MGGYSIEFRFGSWLFFSYKFLRMQRYFYIQTLQLHQEWCEIRNPCFVNWGCLTGAFYVPHTLTLSCLIFFPPLLLFFIYRCLFHVFLLFEKIRKQRIKNQRSKQHKKLLLRLCNADYLYLDCTVEETVPFSSFLSTVKDFVTKKW